MTEPDALIFFGILIISIVGVDLLGNRAVFFLVGDVTPAVGFAVLAAGLALLLAATAHQHHSTEGYPPAPSAGSVAIDLAR